MCYKRFIGVDVSKESIDCCVHGLNCFRQFGNHPKGYDQFLSWLLKQLDCELHTEALICFEHTGMYSLALACYLDDQELVYNMIPPLELKRSTGIHRGKSDQEDAKMIARYAHVHRDTIAPNQLPSRKVLKLRTMLTLRNRLAAQRAGYKATQMEQKRFLPRQQALEVLDIYADVIGKLAAKIEDLERSILELIQEDQDMKTSFDLITSIKGVGLITATYFIVYTHNFTRFKSWRKFACYCGIAPFKNESGNMKKKSQVSPLANKQMKRLLHLSAMIASYSDNELRTYYQKRLEEGKHRMEVLNIIRNKIVARVFAVVKRGTPYVELGKYAA